MLACLSFPLFKIAGATVQVIVTMSRTSYEYSQLKLILLAMNIPLLFLLSVSYYLKHIASNIRNHLSFHFYSRICRSTRQVYFKEVTAGYNLP